MAGASGLDEADYNLAMLYQTANKQILPHPGPPDAGREVDLAKAVTLYRRAAMNNFPKAQFAVSCMYFNGHGVKRDIGVAIKFCQLAAEQEFGNARGGLDEMQGYIAGNPGFRFSPPPVGTRVTVILLKATASSSSATQYNDRRGMVVGGGGLGIKPGRVAVKLDDHEDVLSFKFINLRVLETGWGEVPKAPGKDQSSGSHIDGSEESQTLCPICYENEDDAHIGDKRSSICCACGKSYCGACTATMSRKVDACPLCRNPFPTKLGEREMQQLEQLLADRPHGRTAAHARHMLGSLHMQSDPCFVMSTVQQDVARGFKLIMHSAEDGFDYAMFDVALAYMAGHGVEKNEGQAFRWMKRAAEKDFPYSFSRLGGYYLEGCGVTKNEEEAVKWLMLASEQCGHPDSIDAELSLAKLYANRSSDQIAIGFDAAKSAEQMGKSVKWLQTAVEDPLGSKEAREQLLGMQTALVIPEPPLGSSVTVVCLTSAAALQYNGKKGKVVKDVEEQAAGSGRVAVLLDDQKKMLSLKLMNVAVSVWNGPVIVPPGFPDPDAYEHACTSCWGNEEDATVKTVPPSLCYDCGHMTCGACKEMISRIGVCPKCREQLHVPAEANFKRVLKLVQSMEPMQGTSPGRHLPTLMHSLGALYRTGHGVTKDLVQALKWIRAAAELGYGMAQFDLGTMIQFGRGTPKDPLEGMKWKMKAAQSGAETRDAITGLTLDMLARPNPQGPSACAAPPAHAAATADAGSA